MPKNFSSHFTAFAFVTAFLLAGCGQKGPLYLEKTEKTPQEKTTPTATPSSKATDNIGEK